MLSSVMRSLRLGTLLHLVLAWAVVAQGVSFSLHHHDSHPGERRLTLEATDHSGGANVATEPLCPWCTQRGQTPELALSTAVSQTDAASTAHRAPTGHRETYREALLGAPTARAPPDSISRF